METITQANKFLYTAKTITKGGREHGESRSSDGISILNSRLQGQTDWDKVSWFRVLNGFWN